MLNWLFWNRTVFTLKLYYAKLNFSKVDCFDIQQCGRKLYLHETELFELELFD